MSKKCNQISNISCRTRHNNRKTKKARKFCKMSSTLNKYTKTVMDQMNETPKPLEQMKNTVCYLLGEQSINGPMNESAEDDSAVLQDLDLVILAAPPELYKSYAELSRQEWCILGEYNYNNLRKKFYIDTQPSTSAQGQRNSTIIRKYENQSINTSKYNHKTYYRKMLKRALGLCTTPKENRLPRRQFNSPKKLNGLDFSRNIHKNGLRNHSKMNIQKSNCKSNTLEEGEIVDTYNIVRDQNNDDDCICIESTVESITIEDDPPNETVALFESFSKRTSSTPLYKRDRSVTLSDEPLPYFTDIQGSPFMQTANKIQYNNKLSILGTTSEKDLHKKTTKDANIDTVIILDETDVSNAVTPAPIKDDSVVFVSETKELEFIPVTPFKELPNQLDKKRKPKRSHQTHTNSVSLFTASEKKRLNAYNSNAYNPDTETKQNTTQKRMVIIDGSNVAFSHSLNKCFSVRGIKIVINYFEKMGHDVKVVVPQFRLGKYKSTEPEELERLHSQGKIVFTPCKNLPGKSATSYDDRLILQLAFELDAVIISNDNYRDLIHENIAFKKIIENRVVGYSWCNDIFILPKDPYGKWGPSLSSILNRM